MIILPPVQLDSCLQSLWLCAQFASNNYSLFLLYTIFRVVTSFGIFCVLLRLFIAYRWIIIFLSLHKKLFESQTKQNKNWLNNFCITFVCFDFFSLGWLNPKKMFAENAMQRIRKFNWRVIATQILLFLLYFFPGRSLLSV